MHKTTPPLFEPMEEATTEPDELGATKDPVMNRSTGVRCGANARLTAFYLSRDRALTLLDVRSLPTHLLAALQGQDVTMASTILSNAIGAYLLDTIASGGLKTLQELAFAGTLKPGAPFIYDGHFSGKGFGADNKKSALTLTEKLD